MSMAKKAAYKDVKVQAALFVVTLFSTLYVIDYEFTFIQPRIVTGNIYVDMAVVCGIGTLLLVVVVFVVNTKGNSFFKRVIK